MSAHPKEAVVEKPGSVAFAQQKEEKGKKKEYNAAATPPPAASRRDGDASARQAPPPTFPLPPPLPWPSEWVAPRLRRRLPLARARLVITFRGRCCGGSGEEVETDSGVPARRCGRHGRRLVRCRPAVPSLLPGYRLRRHRPNTRGLDCPHLRFGSIQLFCVQMCVANCSYIRIRCSILLLAGSNCTLQHSISITGRV